MGLGESVEQAKLMWFGHVMRMKESRYPGRIHESVVPRVRARGRPVKRWVNKNMRAHGQDVKEVKMCMASRMS